MFWKCKNVPTIINLTINLNMEDFMTVESKLDTIIGGLADIHTAVGSVLTAVQAIPGADTSAITASLSKIDSEVQALQAEVGTDQPAPTPTPAPTSAPAPAQ